jgi:hypothetical protein
MNNKTAESAVAESVKYNSKKSIALTLNFVVSLNYVI